jgi:hypothetical protein
MRTSEWMTAVALGLWGLGCGGAQAPAERARYEPPPALPPFEPETKKGDPLDALDELEAAAKAEQHRSENAPGEGAERGEEAPGEVNSDSEGPKEPESPGPSP